MFCVSKSVFSFHKYLKEHSFFSIAQSAWLHANLVGNRELLRTWGVPRIPGYFKSMVSLNLPVTLEVATIFLFLNKDNKFSKCLMF